MSYSACNKTSLSRKPYIPDKNLLRTAIRKSWSLFQNPSWKCAWSAPWRRTDDDVISGRHTTPLSLKPCTAAKKLVSWSLGRSFRIRRETSCEAPVDGEITMTSCPVYAFEIAVPVCNETSLSWKPLIEDKKLLLNTFTKSWSLSNFTKNSKY